MGSGDGTRAIGRAFMYAGPGQGYRGRQQSFTLPAPDVSLGDHNQEWHILMSDATNRAKAADKAGERESMEPGHQDKGLPEQTSQRIGDELKAFYDGLVSEPLPDRFVQLLQQLEQREKAKKNDDAGGSGK